MHIMLFGGTFDPPHIGHQTVANAIIENHLADEIWYVPCELHPFGKKTISADDRLHMLQLITTEKIKVTDYEITHTEISYSYDTLKHFQQTLPQHTFSWIIGSDQLPAFHKWKSYEKLLKDFKVYVYPRKNFPFQPLYEGMIPLIDMPEIEVSSTEVRVAIEKDAQFEQYLDPKIYTYIKTHNLYTSI